MFPLYPRHQLIKISLAIYQVGISVLHKVPGAGQLLSFLLFRAFFFLFLFHTTIPYPHHHHHHHINQPRNLTTLKKTRKTMGKPIHPATVHFPISFLFLSFTLDILHSTRASLPTSLQNSLLGPHDLTSAAHSLLSLGLLTAIPAVVTGGRELITMIQKQGMYESDGVTVKTKVKATIAHAVAMDVLLAVSSWIWYSRRRGDVVLSEGGGGLDLKESTDAAVYAHSTSFVVAEFLTLGLLLLGANIGGTLTYNYGVGFSSLSKAGKKDGKKKSL